MTRLRLMRVTLFIGLLLLPGIRLDAAAPTGGEPPPTQKSLRGHFLIAPGSMGDPRFDRTVILMIRHDAKGAFGLVVNRVIGRKTVSALMELMGEKIDAPNSVPVYYGGPVQPERAYIVHSADYRRPETTQIDTGMAITSTKNVLADIARGKGPEKFLFAFGYAGWGPGQLEGELARNGWFIAAATPKLVFDEDRDKLWEAALARRIRDL